MDRNWQTWPQDNVATFFKPVVAPDDENTSTYVHNKMHQTKDPQASVWIHPYNVQTQGYCTITSDIPAPTNTTL